MMDTINVVFAFVSGFGLGSGVVMLSVSFIWKRGAKGPGFLNLATGVVFGVLAVVV